MDHPAYRSGPVAPRVVDSRRVRKRVTASRIATARACDNSAMRQTVTALCLLCAPLFAEDAAHSAKDPYRLHPDHMRTPFSAAEIRAGCPVGRVSIFRMDSNGQRALQVFHFLTNDEKGADFEVAMLSPDGKQQIQQSKSRSTWVQFQSHASFAKDITTRSEARITTPAGTFDCWRYLVVERKPGKTSEKRLYFAKRIPGPPIKMTTHVNGKMAFEMALVEHKDGTEAAMLNRLGFKGVAGAPDEKIVNYAAAFAKLESPEVTEADYVKARVHAAEAVAIFKALDKDADGKLSAAECTPEKLFQRLDHDANRSVSAEEFATVTARWLTK